MVRQAKVNLMTHEFLAPIAKQPLNLSVDTLHARMIGDHDCVRSCLQQLAELPLALRNSSLSRQSRRFDAANDSCRPRSSSASAPPPTTQPTRDSSCSKCAATPEAGPANGRDRRRPRASDHPQDQIRAAFRSRIWSCG